MKIQGYWFLAPYANIIQEQHAKKYYQACQTGPAIYDSNGELVWSGACAFKNQNACDFRAWEFSNHTLALSTILTSFRDVNDSKGSGVFMDNNYQTTGNLYVPEDEYLFNMHELNLVDDGRRAIHLAHKPVPRDMSAFEGGLVEGWILDIGFREIDMETGAVTFEWWAATGGHIDPAESKVEFIDYKAWDFLHANSVEKSSDGDYLFSARYTDTIYKISGRDGTVLWRLGGMNSSFHQDFSFSRQHDARWLPSDQGKEVITFLDNGSDENSQIHNTSFARVVELDTSISPWVARSLLEIPRPDGLLSRLRGNFQTLPNGNPFVCWSENGIVSEHSPDGNLLMTVSGSISPEAHLEGYTDISSGPFHL